MEKSVNHKRGTKIQKMETSRFPNSISNEHPAVKRKKVSMNRLPFIKFFGVPKGIRTPVAGVKGRCPWPTRRWGH